MRAKKKLRIRRRRFGKKATIRTAQSQKIRSRHSETWLATGQKKQAFAPRLTVENR